MQDPRNQQVQDQYSVLNVTKTRNYDNCLTESQHGKSNVHFSQNNESPVNSYNFVKYNITQQPRQQHQTPIIESVYSEGKISYKNFGDELLVVVHQNVTLQQVTSGRSVPSVSRPQRYDELTFQLPTQSSQSSQSKNPMDIPYYYLFDQPQVSELAHLVPQLLNSLAQEIESNEMHQQKRNSRDSTKETLQKTVQIVNALAVLPKSVLSSIYEQVAHQGKNPRSTPREQVVRKLYLDSLPLCGSNEAALFIKQLIEQDKVTIIEARELVEAVPQNLYMPDVATIDAYLDLFQNSKVQSRRHLAASCGIAFGKLVKQAYVKRQNERSIKKSQQQQQYEQHQRIRVEDSIPLNLNGISNRIKRSWESKQHIIEDSDVQKYVQTAARLLEQARTFNQKVTLVETLAHMGVPQALKVLAPYATGSISEDKLPGFTVEKSHQKDEERNFVRQVTLFALAHIAIQYPEHVLPIVLPVYTNPNEPYEVRIAAFTTAMLAQPEKQTLERIASELHRENNKQVKSFVRSVLETFGNFSIPKYEKTSKYAQDALKHAPVTDYGYQYSRMVGADYHDEKREYGLWTMSDWVSSNNSRIPRAGYFAIGQTSGPFQEHLVQIGFNAKGMESMIRQVLDKNGVVSKLAKKMQGKNIHESEQESRRSSHAAQQIMDQIKEKLDLETRHEEEPKATIFFRLFDRTSYFPIDKEYIEQVVNEAEQSLREIAKSLNQGATYHYVKLLMPSPVYKVIPSEIGLPVIVSHRHPIILSLKVENAKVKVETSPRSIVPTGINFTATVTPSIYYSSFSFAFAINPADHQTYGSHVEKTSQFTLPADVTLGYICDKNMLTWSFIPKVQQEVFHHQTQAKTFIAKAKIAVVPDQTWFEDAQTIKALPVPFQWEERYGQEEFGLGLHIKQISENIWHDKPFYFSETAKKQGLIAAAVEVLRNPGLMPREMHVQLEADQHLPINGFEGTVQYKWTASENEGADVDESDESRLVTGESESWNVRSRESRERQEQERRSGRQQHKEDSQSEESYDKVYGYQKVMQQIEGRQFKKQPISKQSEELVQKTRSAWESSWKNELPQSGPQSERMPQTISHNLAVTAIARGPQPTFMAANLLYVHSYDYRTFWFKADGHVKSSRSSRLAPQALCADAVVSYPPQPNELEPATSTKQQQQQQQKVQIKAKAGWGPQCQQGSVVITGQMDRTQEDKVVLDLVSDSKQEQQKWYQKQCQTDIAKGKQLSYACERTALENSYFNRVELDVKYQNVPKALVNLTQKLDLAMKVALFRNLDNNNVDVHNQNDQIRIVAHYSSKIPDVSLVNVRIEKPQETTQYNKIYVPHLRPASSLVRSTKVLANPWTGYQSSSCNLMQEYVRTFDNVTYKMPRSQNQYLIAKDCSIQERFAVYTSQDGQYLKVITVDVAGVQVKIPQPTQQKQVKVIVDGRQVEVTSRKPKTIEGKSTVRISLQQQPQSQSPVVIVEALQEKVKVLCDGKRAKVIVGGKYQGKTCGLCGDNNDETEAEFQGPNGQVYETEEEFVNSYDISSQRRPTQQGN